MDCYADKKKKLIRKVWRKRKVEKISNHSDFHSEVFVSDKKAGFYCTDVTKNQSGCPISVSTQPSVFSDQASKRSPETGEPSCALALGVSSGKKDCNWV